MPAVTQASSGSASSERVMLNTAVDSSSTTSCLHLQETHHQQHSTIVHIYAQ